MRPIPSWYAEPSVLYLSMHATKQLPLHVRSEPCLDRTHVPPDGRAGFRSAAQHDDRIGMEVMAEMALDQHTCWKALHVDQQAFHINFGSTVLLHWTQCTASLGQVTDGMHGEGRGKPCSEGGFAGAWSPAQRHTHARCLRGVQLTNSMFRCFNAFNCCVSLEP